MIVVGVKRTEALCQADSTQISESALLYSGRECSCKTGLGDRKVFLLPELVLRLSYITGPEGSALKCTYENSPDGGGAIARGMLISADVSE